MDYLRILGVSQLFMSLEITTAGAFSGYGKTVPPSVISIVFTALRIPLALILVHTTLGAERDLVEYYDFEYSERCAAVCMVLHIHAGRETYI